LLTRLTVVSGDMDTYFVMYWWSSSTTFIL